jgi:hypothetical protein
MQPSTRPTLRKGTLPILVALLLAANIVGSWIYFSASDPKPGDTGKKTSSSSPTSAPTAPPPDNVRPIGAVAAALPRAGDLSVKQLHERAVQLRALVETKATEVRRLHFGVADPDPENAASPIRIRSDAGDLALRIEREKGRLQNLVNEGEALAGIAPENTKEALALLKIEDPHAGKIAAELEDTKAAEARMLRDGIIAKQAELATVRKRMVAYQVTLTDQLEAIRRAHKTKREIEAAGLLQAEEQWQMLKDPTKLLADYAAAKTAYLRAKADLAEVEVQYQFAIRQQLPPERIRDWRRVRSSPPAQRNP